MSKMFKRAKNILLGVAVIMVAMLVASCAENTPDNPNDPQARWGIDEFVIVLIPADEDAPEVAWTREVFATYLSEVLYGLPVREFHATSYAAGIEAMRNGHAQMAQFGPFAFIQAMERADAEAFAVTSRPTRPGEPGYPEGWINGYYSFIIARTDSGIYTIDDLPGRTFGFVDPASTSGMVVPANDLLNHFGDSHPHLNFETLQVGGQFFSSTMFTGTHANSVQGVLNGDVEAAAVASGQWTAQINAGLFTPDDMRIIHSSEQIPGSPFAFYRGLPEDLKDLVRDFFLGWDNQEFWDIRGMGGDSRSRYMPIDDSAYDIIRELRDRFNLSD